VVGDELLWLTDAGQIAQAVGVAARALRDGPDWTAVSADPDVRSAVLTDPRPGKAAIANTLDR